MKKIKTGVAVFPGSNCAMDCLEALSMQGDFDPVPLWHRESLPDGLDAVVLPGGFTHGDYLRPGALAAGSLLMQGVVKLAHAGLPVLGICNGFQMLLETGLLPGALLENRSGRFVCRDQPVKVAGRCVFLPSHCSRGVVMQLPVAHRSGRYYIDPDGLQRLRDRELIVLQYCDRSGGVHGEVSPNGSVDGIAAVTNSTRNVLGMMPHPERAVSILPSGCDGRVFFEGLRQAVVG